MRKIARSFSVYIVILAIVFGMALFIDRKPTNAPKEVSYTVFTEHIAKKEMKEITFKELEMTGVLKDGSKVHTYAHSSLDIDRLHKTYLDEQSREAVIDVKNTKPEKESWIISIIPTIIMVAALIFFWSMIMRQQGGGKAMSFGKSKARLQKGDGKKTTFKDVAGLEEEKEELEEIVDYLRGPQRYVEQGARIPKGVLLVGPPGTGKTYLSKATAGEAGVPFFTISGSDFVEMFVGVGASRVRDLFHQAKSHAPCIIFIDEIDAVGRRRGAGMGGGHDEREQTLNQLLVEMDGFDENAGIIILAATNRPDILDPALLRPGRFDRQVLIGVPDIKAREEIFAVHSRNKALDEDVDLKVLARRTPGFTPADIENMLNEAALLSIRRRKKLIGMAEIEEAITKVIAGPEKKSRVVNEKERWLTAVHEAGHAIVARATPDTDPVHQITIVPRGRAGGFTMTLPKEERQYVTKTDMENAIVHLLGGRVAEQIVLKEISTGASNDIQRATDIARDMVTKYGFSENLGPINYSSSEEVFLGRDFGAKQQYSEETSKEIDQEVKGIIHEAYERATAIINENLDKLNEVARTLMELETIDGKQFEQLFVGEQTCDSLVGKGALENESKEAVSEEQKGLQISEENSDVEPGDEGREETDGKEPEEENLV